MAIIWYTDRDEKIIYGLAQRGWATQNYLIQFFPSYQAMINRLRALNEMQVIYTTPTNTVLKRANLKIPSSEYEKYFPIKSNLYRLSDSCYRSLRIRNKNLSLEKMAAHQIFQEYVELYLKNTFGIKEIEVDHYKRFPKPDLYFNCNGKNFSVEIERSLKRNPNYLTIEKTKKDGTIRQYRRKPFRYYDHIDNLFNFSDRVIYVFEVKEDLIEFSQINESRYVYVTTLDSLDKLINKQNEVILTESLLRS